MLLTIFTPTYNRANLLKRLYQSILNQSNKKTFEWLIIDDGSTDNTQDVVQDFIEEKKIIINYIKKKNQGKMQAHNTALEHARGKWFHCIDSDDYFADSAFDLFFEQENVYFDDSKVVGICLFKKLEGQKIKFKEKINGNMLSRKELARNGYHGELSVFFKTDILKQYPFPKFGDEKFVHEAIVYQKIEAKYKYIVYNSYNQIAEYQQDGYTFNDTKLAYNNPFGSSVFYKQSAKFTRNPLKKIKKYANYIAFSRLVNQKKTIHNSGNVPFCLVAYPLGLMYYKKYKKRYAKEKAPDNENNCNASSTVP